MSACLLFRVSATDLALPLASLREVLPCPMLRPAPGMPWMMAGLFALDGGSAVALRLDRVLGLAEASLGLYAPLIRLRGRAIETALLVDAVLDVVQVDEVRPAPVQGSFNGAVTGLVEAGGRIWHLLDVDRLLLAQEQGAVSEFALRAADRLARLDAGA